MVYVKRRMESMNNVSSANFLLRVSPSKVVACAPEVLHFGTTESDGFTLARHVAVPSTRFAHLVAAMAKEMPNILARKVFMCPLDQADYDLHNHEGSGETLVLSGSTQPSEGRDVEYPYKVHIRKYFWKKRGEKPRPGTDGFCVILREFGDIARGLALLFKKTLPAGNFRTFERSFLIDKAEELAAAAASLDEARREVQKFVDEPSKNHREALSKKAAAEDAPAPSAHDIADFVDVCATPLLNFTYARMLEHIYEQELGKMREDRPSAAFNGDGDDAPPSKRRRGNGIPKPDAPKDAQ